MTDILERLRAAKPVLDSPPPSIEPIWEQIDQYEARRSARRASIQSIKHPKSRQRLAASATLLVGGLVASLVALTGEPENGIVARAYAATDSNGVVVYYVEDRLVRPASDSGASFQSMRTVARVWVSGVHGHIIDTNDFRSRGQRTSSFEQEIAFDGTRVENYQGHNTIFISREAPRGSCTPITTCASGVPADPVAELHHLYQTGALTATGETTFRGRRVAVLVGGHGGNIRVLVDARSGFPLLISQTYGSRPWPASPTVTTTITQYQRLPLTPQTRQLLAMRRYPGAHVIHIPGSGGMVTQGRPKRLPPRPLPPLPGQVIEQINLSPPDDHSGATGIAEIVHSRTSSYLRVTAERIEQPSANTVYAVWLIRDHGGARLLGFINRAPDRHQRLRTEGALPADAAHYNEILITIESRPRPNRPGTIILHGSGSF
jgi:hypothetical protein